MNSLLKKSKAPATKAAAKEAPVKKGPFGRPAGAASGAKKKAVKRAPLPSFKAPADMKPCFIEFDFKTAKDGLVGPGMNISRVKGGWALKDEDGKPKNRRYNMFEYDPKTAAALISRFCTPMWKTKIDKRLPGNTTFRVIFRVGVKKDSDVLRATIAAVFQVKEIKGKNRLVKLEDSTDVNRRLIRRVGKYLPGALTSMQLPPVGRAKKEEEE